MLRLSHFRGGWLEHPAIQTLRVVHMRNTDSAIRTFVSRARHARSRRERWRSRKQFAARDRSCSEGHYQKNPAHVTHVYIKTVS